MAIAFDVLKDNHYPHVLEKDFEPYKAFRMAHEMQVFTHGDMTLKYFDIGEGPILLCLPGSTGKALTFYPFVETLSTSYRMIIIDYPEAEGLTSLTLKIMNFMREMAFEPAYIFANSFGTVVAQSLMIKMPSQIAGVVLAHGVTKTDKVPSKTIRYHQKGLKSFMKSIKFLNFSRFQKKFAKQLRKNVNLYNDDTSRRLFWEGLYQEMLFDTTKAQMLSNYGFMKDFWESTVFEPTQFELEDTKIIIVESYDDHEGNKPEKLGLRSLFKHADYEVLSGDGHMSMVKNSDKISEYVKQLNP
jgi:pimeloyl-ACP methyl ester carboxylesterase